MEEQTAEMAKKLMRCYGDMVSVEYVDVLSPRMAEHQAAMRVITQRNLPLPMISIDGKPRFAGGVSVEAVSEALEKLGLVPLSAAD